VDSIEKAEALKAEAYTKWKPTEPGGPERAEAVVE